MAVIDCHTHTRNSDGSDDVLDMVYRAEEMGHCALVITDHDTCDYSAYPRARKEVDILIKLGLLPIPVIVGAEIMTPFGEYLLFGTQVLKRWQQHKKALQTAGREFDHTLWVELFKKYVLHKNTYSMYQQITQITQTIALPYALIVCHPRFSPQYPEAIPASWWELVHGFEIRNGLKEYDVSNKETVEVLRTLMPGAMELQNSDAHRKAELGRAANEVNFNEVNEDQLCKWLRSGRKNYRLNHPLPKLDAAILEEHMRGIECTQKMLEGMHPCPSEYLEVISKNMEDLLE